MIFKVQISFPQGLMRNQKINYPIYSRSLLFELHCYDDEMTKKNFNPRLISLIYMKINFNENGIENSPSEARLDLNQ